jgi:hypothetical protein
MNAIKWIAGNGQEVEVSNITEEQNIVDHTVVNKIDEIEVRLGGNSKIFQGVVDGMIQVMGGKIRIPEDLKKDVSEMIENCEKRRNERMEKSEKINADYEKNYRAVKMAMEQ